MQKIRKSESFKIHKIIKLACLYNTHYLFEFWLAAENYWSVSDDKYARYWSQTNSFSRHSFNRLSQTNLPDNSYKWSAYKHFAIIKHLFWQY